MNVQAREAILCSIKDYATQSPQSIKVDIHHSFVTTVHGGASDIITYVCVWDV